MDIVKDKSVFLSSLYLTNHEPEMLIGMIQDVTKPYRNNLFAMSRKLILLFTPVPVLSYLAMEKNSMEIYNWK